MPLESPAPTNDLNVDFTISNENLMKINVIQALVTVILAASSVNAWSEGMINKCKNQQGELIYQKSPCNASADTVTSWTPKAVAKPQVSETGQDKDAKKQPSPVKIYTQK